LLIFFRQIVFSQLADTFSQIENGTFEEKSASKTIQVRALYFVYIAIGAFVCQFVSRFGFIFTGERVTHRIQNAYLESVLRQNMAFFDDRGSGELAMQLTADTEKMQQAISEKLAMMISALGTLAATLILSFVLYWKLTLILLWSLVFGALIYFAGKRVGKRFTVDGRSAESAGNSMAEEAISAIRTTASLGLEDVISERFHKYLDLMSKNGLFMKSFTGLLLGCAVGAGYINFALAFWQGTRFFVLKEASFIDVVTIALATKTATFSILGVSGNVDAFVSAIAVSRQLFSVIHRPSPIDSASTTGLTLDNVKGQIEFRNVKHIYPARSEKAIFTDLNIRIEAGQTVGIVGLSGSGKSTIVHLLERFYELAQGSILLDGQDIKSLNVAWLRSQICLVDQEPFLFDGSIKNNILDGLPRATIQQISDQEKSDLVETAAKAACAHEFIMRLPLGYNNWVGTNGLSLSGGQKQRIAIARALISTARILILDEATAALDTETERSIQQELKKQRLNRSHGRTTLIITHRLSTIEEVDNILVFMEGRVIEQGTHSSLMAAKGSYYRLVEMQKSEGASANLKENQIAWTEKESGDIEDRSAKFLDQKIQEDSVSKEGIKSQDSRVSRLRFIASLSRREFPVILGGIVSSLLAGCEEPVAAILFGECVEILSRGIKTGDDDTQSKVNFWSLMFLVLALVQCFAFCVQGAAFAYCSEKLLHTARYRVLRAILKQNIAFFDSKEHSAGSLISFLATETTHLAGISGATFGTVLISLSTLVAALIVSCIYGWKLALICASLVPVIFAGGFYGVRIAGSHQAKTAHLFSSASSFANNSLSGIRTVTALNRQKQILSTFGNYHRDAQEKSLGMNTTTSLFFALSQSVLYCCMALGCWYGGTLITSREYTLFQFTVVYSTVLLSSLSAGIVFSYAPDFGRAFQAASKLQDLLEKQSTIDYTSNDGLRLVDPRGEIEFQNASFSYPSSPEKEILSNFSLKIPSQQHIAFVGETGCGKTTIFSLLERFYDTNSGQILIDGVPIKDLNVRDYRRMIGLVTQEPVLFSGTILENLICGQDDVPDEVVEKVCREANIYDFIKSLP
jgi:ATP-binding cassette subfamily B (MDR/TAP) protein 1